MNDNMSGADLYKEYDMKFSVDVSRQMQMPDRIAAFDGMRQLDGFKADATLAFDESRPAFGMTMPDRIFLGETDYTADSGLSMTSKFDDDDSLEEFIGIHEPMTPVRKLEDVDQFSARDYVVPPTPGSMLRDGRMAGGGNVTDWMRIQRHVAKLTCRVERLEEENSRRRQREWLLYPLVLGYCLLQVARLFVGRAK